jgi:DNA-directed RNA polymerase
MRAISALVTFLTANYALRDGQPVGKAAVSAVGRAIYYEYLMQHFSTAAPPLFNTIMREFSKTLTQDEASIVRRFRLEYTRRGHEFPLWEFGDQQNVGHYLLRVLTEAGLIEQWVNVDRILGKPRKRAYIRIHRDLQENIDKIAEYAVSAPSVAGPLIEPPVDWNARTNSGGGFHTAELRQLYPFAVQRSGARAVAPAVVATLNSLQRQPWQINAAVLAAVTEVSRTVSIPGIPTSEPPPRPVYPGDDASEEASAEFKVLARRWHAGNKVRVSQRMRSQKALNEARDLEAHKQIYFSYYADHRGRKYARAGSISPQGCDLEKGLIRFANGKPLATPEAIFWFKVYGAGRFGHDKLPLAERAAWVDSEDAMLRAVGDDPVNQTGWTLADEPVQFLSWVLEYAEFRRDPAGFLSRLPMAQDGTASGCQHYSALLADEVGGASVNLVPGETKQDVYAEVAKRTTEILLAEEPSKFRDAWLAHGINRKVTKRPCMTLPYGSTRFSVADFILQDYVVPVKPPEIEMADYHKASNYLSYRVWQAIGDVLIKSRQAMDWLQKWSQDAVKRGHTVVWTSPSGLRVVNEYSKFKRTEVRSVAFKSRICLQRRIPGLDSRSIAQAVAPNFVHSLDAAHVDAVVARCSALGMSVSAIHDDFGTHAADVPTLHRIIRETFVAQYSDTGMLQRLADSTGFTVPPPERGSLDVTAVLNSTYFFA